MVKLYPDASIINEALLLMFPVTVKDDIEVAPVKFSVRLPVALVEIGITTSVHASGEPFAAV
jgi:hypothetical protein